MLKNLTLVIIIKFFVFTYAFGQITIRGQIKDVKSTGIPFANIGIKNSKTGTTSSEDGKFNIVIADSLLKDSLTFSSIGFNEKSFAITSLVNNKNIDITLTEKITNLPEIKITNTKRKTYILGITGRTPMISIPSKSYQKSDIIEQARIIHLKAAAQILDANIFVLSESMKEVNIRVNFYAVEKGLPGKRLIEKTIIKKANLKKGWFSINLREEKIFLNEDFVVSFEYLPSNQNSIVFGAKVGAADSFLRNSSLGLWRKNVVGGCSIYVTAEM